MEDTQILEEEKLLLVDYFQREINYEKKEPYFELVLYARNDGSLFMEKYVDGGSPDEKVTVYDVPEEVYERALEIIRRRELDSWNSLREYNILEGMTFVIRYYDHDVHTRVSSDMMPRNGLDAFREMKGLLLEYTSVEYWHVV